MAVEGWQGGGEYFGGKIGPWGWSETPGQAAAAPEKKNEKVAWGERDLGQK